MSIWNNKTIPFWQEIEKFPNKFTIIAFLDTDPRVNWPESFKPSIDDIVDKLIETKRSYIKIKDDGEVCFLSILAEKIIISCTFFKDTNELILNKKNGLQYATNNLKTSFIRDGIRIEHEGIYIHDGKRLYYEAYDEDHNQKLADHIKKLVTKIGNMNAKIANPNEKQIDEEDEFSESESSKIEEILETLEAYINKEYEIEDTKARAQKPFVYIDFKAEDIASAYKYYYRITLLKEDIKRLRELNPSMLQIKKTDETFMDLEVFNIKPDNSPNDIIVTTSFQTDRNMIDNSNELFLVAIATLQKVRQRVINDLRSKVSPNKWLVPLAAGVYSFNKTIKASVPEYNEKYPLLPAQRDGVEKGAGSKDITLVLGPPGTGKTTVILSWVKFFVTQGMKVLVTSQNNKAVDNVLERLAKEKDLECLRVGNESKVSSSIHHLLIENYSLNAQSKLVANLSDVISSLEKSKNYLLKLNSVLKELSQYDSLEMQFQKEIHGYIVNRDNQKNKIYTKKQEKETSKNTQNFLEELLNALKQLHAIQMIEHRLTLRQNELDAKLHRETLLHEQLKKNKTKLETIKQEFINTNQKVNSYPSQSSLFKFFTYLSNQKNIRKLNLLSADIAMFQQVIEKSNHELQTLNDAKIVLQESVAKVEIELATSKNAVPKFLYALSLSNCETKYEEFFKKQSLFSKFLSATKESLESKIEQTQKALVENSKRINEYSQILDKEEAALRKYETLLMQTEQRYADFKASKPQIPEFTPCDYIDDSIYKNFYPNSDTYKRLISKTTEDLAFYSPLLEIIVAFEKNMHSERQSSLYETILEYVDVVGATCIGINSNKLFADIPFDVVIVDESGQIQLHNLMVPLSRASKAILVGDHKQLPPVVDDELAAELEEQGFDPIFLQKSWFEILWDPMPEDHKTMLDTQFRCPAIISNLVSKAFYESKYFAGSGMEKKQPILPYFNTTMTFIDTSKVFPSFEQSRITDGRTEVVGNEVETTIIIDRLMYLLKELPYLKQRNDEGLFEIAIIVPYKNHVNEIKKVIRNKKLDIGELIIDDLVASVDSFQGQEKDVIIFAFSRSNKGGNIGFLADWRRLNVAMTRTKKQLIMVGSLKTLTMDNQKEHEAEFKQAMRILESELSAKDSIIDGRKFVSGAKK